MAGKALRAKIEHCGWPVEMRFLSLQQSVQNVRTDLLLASPAGNQLKHGWIKHDPDLDPLRTHPRYQKILELVDR